MTPLEAQRASRDEMRYMRKLRRAMQVADDPLPGRRGLDRLNRELDRLPRPGWLSRWIP
jgi:hypothetical protein